MSLMKKLMDQKNVIRSPDQVAIHLDSKTSYDHLVSPPSLEDIPHVLKNRPVNYTTVDTNYLIDYVLEKLSNHDTDFLKLSPIVKKQLRGAIKWFYLWVNYQDLNQDGDGLITPTFIEILSDFIFWTKDKKLPLTLDDKRVLSKYQWTRDLYLKVVAKHRFGVDIDVA